jgi:hypothetical protein
MGFPLSPNERMTVKKTAASRDDIQLNMESKSKWGLGIIHTFTEFRLCQR